MPRTLSPAWLAVPCYLSVKREGEGGVGWGVVGLLAAGAAELCRAVAADLHAALGCLLIANRLLNVSSLQLASWYRRPAAPPTWCALRPTCTPARTASGWMYRRGSS